MVDKIKGYLYCPIHDTLYECDRWICPSCEKVIKSQSNSQFRQMSLLSPKFVLLEFGKT